MIAARSRYRDVEAPVHLVYGAQDWSRPSDQRANRDLVPDAEHVEVTRAGHFLALERPQLLADILTGARRASGDLT